MFLGFTILSSISKYTKLRIEIGLKEEKEKQQVQQQRTRSKQKWTSSKKSSHLKWHLYLLYRILKQNEAYMQ